MRATALAALSFVLLGCTGTTSPTAAVASDPASSTRTEPVISNAAVTPSPPPDPRGPYTCTDASGGTTGTATVNSVRVTPVSGYDEFVVQFDSQTDVPKYTVKRQAKPVFTQGATGQTITLSGTYGVLVTLHSTSENGSDSGPTDFTNAGYPVLKEARLTQDFEGTVAWGLGLGTPACMRVYTIQAPLPGPARLVIDFTTAAS